MDRSLLFAYERGSFFLDEVSDWLDGCALSGIRSEVHMTNGFTHALDGEEFVRFLYAIGELVFGDSTPFKGDSKPFNLTPGDEVAFNVQRDRVMTVVVELVACDCIPHSLQSVLNSLSESYHGVPVPIPGSLVNVPVGPRVPVDPRARGAVRLGNIQFRVKDIVCV